MNKVILVEFNELCPTLLNQWMGSGLLPNFKRLHDQSEVFVTEADTKEPVNLEPWIQWYSIHTGLPFTEHKVFHLTDGPRAGHPDIWSILAEKGKRVWNCSSMNVRRHAEPGSAFLPDPWCTSEAPYPPELGDFHRFVSGQVREYSNSSKASNISQTVAFLRFMLGHGLRVNTVLAIAKQLWSEVASGKKTSWQRVALQDKLQFDVFAYYFRKLRPDFSTFFANSTAHLQHSFWRNMEPAAFVVKPDEHEQSKYEGAIQFGYQQMDRLLGDILKLAGTDTRVIFATALSQQPYLKYESVGGHHFYRPRNIDALFQRLGLQAKTTQPVMTHQYLARFESADAAIHARKLLESLRIDGKAIFGFDESEPDSLYFGSQIRNVLPAQTRVSSTLDANLQISFFDIFYKIEGLKSGRHHPDGCLWIQSAGHKVHNERASILDILPTITQLLGVPVSGYQGRKLI